MTFVKNILCASMISFSLLCAMQQPVIALFNKELHEEFTLKLSSYALRQTRTLTSNEVSALANILASTSETAGSDAVTYLSNLAKTQPNVVTAFFNICTALTTPDATNGGATPISLATPEVRKALSTGKIAFLNDDYNYTLLHFAALFSVIGGEITPATDSKTPAATIISTILTDLTQAEILSAIQAQDKWSNTPLHYAAMAPATNQELVTNALLSKLTSTTDKATAISTQNIWNCTPVHHAASFAVNNHALVDSLFTDLTISQKRTALVIQDQWSTTALTYARLFKNISFYRSAFWQGISKANKISDIKSGYLGNFDGFILSSEIQLTQRADIFDIESLSFNNYVCAGLTKRDLAGSGPGVVLTPTFEFETIIAKSFIQDQL